ncbi:MAG: hypothetical protein KBC22_00855 [Candidatus Pacebacteria bacterium]|nr:hypothetical protein [Candidatus Paceibacterota bacterium]
MEHHFGKQLDMFNDGQEASNPEVSHNKTIDFDAISHSQRFTLEYLQSIKDKHDGELPYEVLLHDDLIKKAEFPTRVAASQEANVINTWAGKQIVDVYEKRNHLKTVYRLTAYIPVSKDQDYRQAA